MLLKQHVRFGFSQNFLARVRRFFYLREFAHGVSLQEVCVKKETDRRGIFH